MGASGVLKGAGIVLATPAVVKAVTNKPDIVSSTPNAVIDAGLSSYDLGDLLTNPTLAKAEEYVEKHPITTATILAGTTYAGYKFFGFLSTAYNSYLLRKSSTEHEKRELDELDKKTKDETGTKDFVQSTNPTTNGAIVQNFYVTQPPGLISAPASQQTETATKTPQKKHRKAPPKKKKAPTKAKPRTKKSKKKKKKNIKRGKS
jgi:hypothetical protein